MESGFLQTDIILNGKMTSLVSILVLMESGFLQLKKPFYDGKRDMFLSLF